MMSNDILSCIVSGNRINLKAAGTIYEYKYNPDAIVERVGEIHTISRTIGWPGYTSGNYAFTSVANSNAQEFDFGNVIPQSAKVLKVEVVCTQALAGSGAHDILFRVGNATTGQQFLADIECGDDYEVVNGLGATIEAVPMVYTGKSKIFVGANPDANWDTYTAGKWTVLITYIDYLLR